MSQPQFGSVHVPHDSCSRGIPLHACPAYIVGTNIESGVGLDFMRLVFMACPGRGLKEYPLTARMPARQWLTKRSIDSALQRRSELISIDFTRRSFGPDFERLL